MKKENDCIKLLINQFKDSKGYKKVDINSKRFKQEFDEWLKELRNIGYDYLRFLEDLEIEYAVSDTVEIGKCYLDSVVLDNGKTSIITPYANNIAKISSNPITMADFDVYGDSEIATNGNKLIPIYGLMNRFMTQNPYSFNDLNNWDRLHNTNRNITIGLYGKVKDKDKDKKIKCIKEIKEKLLDTKYNEKYTVIDDSYLYVLSSTNNVSNNNKDDILVYRPLCNSTLVKNNR